MTEDIEVASPEQLALIAISDKGWARRQEATELITDEAVLKEIANNDDAWTVRQAALERVADEAFLRERAVSDDTSTIRLDALARVNDPTLFEWSARNDDEYVRESAAQSFVASITDQRVLTEMATADECDAIRAAAACLVEDQAVLGDLVVSDPSGLVRSYVARVITSNDLLLKVALSDEDADTAEAATNNVTTEEDLIAISLGAVTSTARGLALSLLYNEERQPRSQRNHLRAPVSDALLGCTFSVAEYDDDFRNRVAAQKLLALSAMKIELASFVQRERIISHLYGTSELGRLTGKKAPQDTRGLAQRRIDVLKSPKSEEDAVELLRNSGSYNVRDDALDAISTESILLDVALGAFRTYPYEHIFDTHGATTAARKLTDQETISRIALESTMSSVREDMVWRLKDQDVLAQMALSDEDQKVRHEAALRLRDASHCAQVCEVSDDESVLLSLFERISDTEVRLRAINRLSDQQRILEWVERREQDADPNSTWMMMLNRLAVVDGDTEIRAAAQKKIESLYRLRKAGKVIGYVIALLISASFLALIAFTIWAWLSDGALVWKLALTVWLYVWTSTDLRTRVAKRQARRGKPRNENPSVLRRLAKYSLFWEVRLSATEALEDQEILSHIATHDRNYKVRATAVLKLEDHDLLEAIAQTDKHEDVREAADLKLNPRSLGGVVYLGLTAQEGVLGAVCNVGWFGVLLLAPVLFHQRLRNFRDR